MKRLISIFILLCVFISCEFNDLPNKEFNTKIKFHRKSLQKLDHQHRYDGAIMVPNQNGMLLMLLDSNPDADWNDRAYILWKWSVKQGNGVPDNQLSRYRSVFTNLSDVKRIMYQDQIHLIYCGSHGNGVAMMNMGTGNVIYWTNAGGSPHAIAATPDGNIAVADAKGYIKIFSTLTSNNKHSQQFRHAGAHGVVWDGKQELLWAWGGTRMEAYTYNNDRANPKLTPVKRYRLPDSWGKGGGHDLAPVLESTSLIFSWRLGIGLFNTITGSFVELSRKTNNPKGLSYNPFNEEIIYTRPDSKDSRTYRVRSLTEKDRAMKGGKWYKARWFIHNTFSYPIN